MSISGRRSDSVTPRGLFYLFHVHFRAMFCGSAKRKMSFVSCRFMSRTGLFATIAVQVTDGFRRFYLPMSGLCSGSSRTKKEGRTAQEKIGENEIYIT